MKISNAGWSVRNPVYKSRIEISESLSVMSEKKYNWFQRKMWKMLLNINIEKV